MGKSSFTNGVVGALAIAAAAGCGDPFTLAMTSSSSGASTSATSGSGGGGGAGGASGSGMTTPCTAGDLNSCMQGQYCQRDTLSCVSCADVLKQFKFGEAKEMKLPLPMGGSNPRFPRSGPDGQLLFTLTMPFSTLDIGHAKPGGSPLEWQQGEAELTPINTASEDASSLYLPSGKALTGLVDPNVETSTGLELYDSNSQGSRKVFAFNPGQPDLSSVKLMQGTTNFHLTVATESNPARFWYISNALQADPGIVELVTATPGGMPEKVPINDSAGCPVSGDITPWVTPDGNILLFSSKRQEKGDGGPCTSTADEAVHIYYTLMNPMTGQLADMEHVQLQELFLNDTKSYSAPALREDLCVLYFFENVSATETKLYAAVRE